MSRDPAPLDETRADQIRQDRELDEEIEAHLAHRIDDLVERGLSLEAAEEQAISEFGDTDRIKRESREVRADAHRKRGRASRIDALRQDLTHGLRTLRRGPGFAAAALLTLMLGVGATVTIVSVVRAVVLEPLPFDEPDRVVFVEMLTPERASFSVSEPVYLDWRAQASSFVDVAAVDVVGATILEPGQPRSIRKARLSHSLLDLLGLSPTIGRFFTPAEDAAAAPAPVALLSPTTWRTDFAADPGVIGRTIDLDGVRHEIIGVLPDATMLLGDADVAVPLAADPGFDRGEHYLSVVARLADGVEIAQADEALDALQTRLNETHGVDLGWSTDIVGAESVLIGDSVTRAGWILLIASGVLLFMACVNVANLLMVRASARTTEVAVRSALGASRGRLVRQLFTETSVLALGGGVLGVALAVGALPVVKAIGASRIPRLDGAELDAFALGVGLLAVGFSTMVCGLAPVLQLRGGSVGAAVGSRRGVAGDPGRRLRSILVTGQVALTVVLLSGTALLLRSFVELTSIDPGFEPEGTLAFRVDMPDASWSWEERGEVFPAIREAVAAVPGVRAAGATAVDPFSGSALANFVAPEGAIPDRAADFTPIQWRVVTPGFFQAMGMELLAGRTFEDRDNWEDGTPIVIGTSLARSTWGEADPIGRRLVWGDPEGSRMTVIGVVEDLRDTKLAEAGLPIVYRPHKQIPWAVMTVVARIDGDPATVAAGIRSRVSDAVPTVPVGEIRSLTENMRGAVAEPRFNLQILGGFAIVGLLLAIIGTYGLTAFDVRRRLPEIGVRLSLGADPESIRDLIVHRQMGTTVLGMAIGIAASLGLSGFIGSLLYGIRATDPASWAAVVAVVGLSTFAATWLPARRATRVDPREVLNAE